MAEAARILVAEDEPIVRLDLCSLLESRGFDVCAQASDGVEAVELARSTAPDLAILDVKMPRLNGIEAARAIIAERPIPIVIVTAYGRDELVARAVDAGVFGYLTKPFREDDLIAAIRTARGRTDAEPPRPAAAGRARRARRQEGRAAALVGEQLELLRELDLFATDTTGRLIEERFALETCRLRVRARGRRPPDRRPRRARRLRPRRLPPRPARGAPARARHPGADEGLRRLPRPARDERGDGGALPREPRAARGRLSCQPTVSMIRISSSSR